MSYRIVFGATFRRCVQQLEKRFPHVRDDVKIGIQAIRDNPHLGDVIPNGYSTRKLRVLSTDIRKGKRGGYRLIYLVEELPDPRIYLLLLYAKPDKGDVGREELRRLIDEL